MSGISAPSGRLQSDRAGQFRDLPDALEHLPGGQAFGNGQAAQHRPARDDYSQRLPLADAGRKAVFARLDPAVGAEDLRPYPEQGGMPDNAGFLHLPDHPVHADAFRHVDGRGGLQRPLFRENVEPVADRARRQNDRQRQDCDGPCQVTHHP